MEMSDPRKNIKAMPHVKDELAHLKFVLRLPTESHVIDYLLQVYAAKRKHISVVEHEEILAQVIMNHSQIRM